VDWDTGLREDNGHVNPLGLCNLERKINPVGHAYKKLISEWRDTLPTESSVLGICP
jgi:beta-glucosidase